MKTALFLTRNLADAQDVAQEVYIKIFRHLKSYEESMIQIIRTPDSGRTKFKTRRWG